MMPKPEPPRRDDVGLALLRSRASPLTGWAKSQKYLSVWRCTRCSSSSSVRSGDSSASWSLFMRASKTWGEPDEHFGRIGQCSRFWGVHAFASSTGPLIQFMIAAEH